MKPTEILMEEHRVIEVGLECLEALTARAEEAGKLDVELAENALEFIRKFADSCHHGKEEVRLFTKLEEKGMPREGGPIGVMLAEHTQGRAYVKGMADAMNAAGSGDEGALKEFAQNARGYVDLLRKHIQKEDNILFPMADNALDEDEQRQLLSSFKEAEEELLQGADSERYFRLIDELAERLGVSREPIERSALACGRFLDKV